MGIFHQRTIDTWVTKWDIHPRHFMENMIMGFWGKLFSEPHGSHQSPVFSCFGGWSPEAMTGDLLNDDPTRIGHGDPRIFLMSRSGTGFAVTGHFVNAFWNLGMVIRYLCIYIYIHIYIYIYTYISYSCWLNSIVNPYFAGFWPHFRSSSTTWRVSRDFERVKRQEHLRRQIPLESRKYASFKALSDVGTLGASLADIVLMW